MPIHENEVLMLALGVGVLLFGLASRSSLTRVPGWRLLALAYGVMMMAWTATVLEGFCLEAPLNLVEHLGYLVGATLLAIWCWGRATETRRGTSR